MKRKILSILLSLVLLLPVAFSLTTFASSNPSSWAVEEVNKAKNEGLVTDSVMMDYQANITREQFCEMVVKAYEKISGEDAEAGNIYFSDTSNVEILKAANLGIVTGYGNNVFGPKDLITREQIAAMLVRMIDMSVSYANINVYNNNNFNDKDYISDWANSSVNFAYDKGIMQGVGNNCIDPQANTTCEQAILLIYRTVDKYYDAEAQLDSVYKLTEEHIAQDEETFVHYTDNIILAFVEKGLTEVEKENIADVIDGDVVAQLAGSINLLQIKVEDSTLNELEVLAEQLAESNKVYYATPDILIDKDIIEYSAYENSQITYAGEDEWWFKAIEADYVWNNYDDFIKTNTVGVIDGGILSSHEDLKDKISFASPYYTTYNNLLYSDTNEELSHGTGTTSIISATRNNFGMTGVANNTNIVFASYSPSETVWFDDNDMTWEPWISNLGCIYALKKEIEAGAKVINCSFAVHFYNEEYYNKNKKDFEEPSYKAYRLSNDADAIALSRATAAAMCELITEGKEFIVVQGAGNGENNSGPGVDATYSGFWAGITPDTCNDILLDYGLDYKKLKSHIIIAGAVEKEKYNNDYIMTDFSNYGNTIDICAPGRDIYKCDSTSNIYSYSDGTSEAAPMVTGTAAVLWGIDPTLTAAEVKDLILKGSKCKAIGVTGEDAGREYPMLNVRGAVEELLKTKTVHISVGDKDTNGRIQDATVSYGNGLSETTDIIGSCDIYLVDDNHEITISKEGYKTITLTVEDKYIGQEANPDIIWLEEKEILLEKEKIELDKISVLRKYSEVFNDYVYDRYALYDIDKDGFPELILVENEFTGFTECQMYTFKNDKVLNLGKKSVHYGFSKYDGNGILSATGGAGVSVLNRIYIQGNTLKEDPTPYLNACHIPGYEEYTYQGTAIDYDTFIEIDNSISRIEFKDIFKLE